MELASTPIYHAALSGSRLPTAPTSIKWLLVTVSFVPKPVSRKVLWVDDCIAEIFIKCPAGTAPAPVILAGEQKLWSLRMDGQVHRLLFAVPPPVLARYTPLAGARAKFNPKTLPVIFRLRNGQGKEMALGGNISRDIPQSEFIALKKMVDTRKGQFLNVVLAKENTPWSLLAIDAFEYTKTMVEGNR